MAPPLLPPSGEPLDELPASLPGAPELPPLPLPPLLPELLAEPPAPLADPPPELLERPVPELLPLPVPVGGAGIDEFEPEPEPLLTTPDPDPFDGKPEPDPLPAVPDELPLAEGGGVELPWLHEINPSAAPISAHANALRIPGTFATDFMGFTARTVKSRGKAIPLSEQCNGNQRT
jgi:hypothetical protein